MNALKNRTTAKLITVLAVVFATLFGSFTSLTGLRSEAEALFYDEGDGEGIATDLSQIAASAINLTKIAERYLDATDERIADVLEVRLRLLSDEGGRYDALKDLDGATNELYDALSSSGMSDKDAAYARSCMNLIRSHGLKAENSPYNAAAREFNRRLKQFPANLLSSLYRISPLELFE